MKYTKEVQTALEQAASFEMNGQEHGYADTYQQLDMAIINIPPDAGHDYPVAYPAYEQLEQLPNSLYVDSLPKLRKVIKAYHAEGGSVYDVQGELDRQQAKMDAVRQLGGSALYGMSFFKNPRYAMDSTYLIDVIPHDWTTTKLGVATYKMYPILPSIEDKQTVFMLGYPSREVVLYLAVEQGLMVNETSRRGVASQFISRAISRIRPR